MSKPQQTQQNAIEPSNQSSNPSSPQWMSNANPSLLPWAKVFEPLIDLPILQLAASDPTWLQQANELLRQHHQRLGRELRFIAQTDVSSQGYIYEDYIAKHHRVPCRYNWHDYYNALVWLCLPLLKNQLNHIQAAEIKQAGIARTGTRDMATLLDESGLVLVSADSELIQALQQRRWHYVLWQNRQRFIDNVQVLVIGHALHEKLRAPYLNLTGQCYWLALDVDRIEAAMNSENMAAQLLYWDQQLTKQLNQDWQQGRFTSQQLFPLPLIGIPNWAEAQTAALYRNENIFRPLSQN